MSESYALIRCSSCLVMNRVLVSKVLQRPVCGSCKKLLEVPSEPIWAKVETFDRAVAYWPETLLVVFTDASLYCKIVEPLLVKLAKEKAGKLKIMKVDMETDQYLPARFKIEKTPTFVLYRNGTELIRVDGVPKDRSELVTWIENLINFDSY